jgi:hypothetical protein
MQPLSAEPQEEPAPAPEPPPEPEPEPTELDEQLGIEERMSQLEERVTWLECGHRPVFGD